LRILENEVLRNVFMTVLLAAAATMTLFLFQHSDAVGLIWDEGFRNNSRVTRGAMLFITCPIYCVYAAFTWWRQPADSESPRGYRHWIWTILSLALCAYSYVAVPRLGLELTAG